jgi:hypothetical protein
VLGAHDVRDGNLDIHEVERIFVHPNFDMPLNDIAILTLKTCATVSTDFVSTIALPDNNEDDFAGRLSTVVGWGLGSREVPSQLPLTVLTNSDCSQVNLIIFTKLKKTEVTFFFFLALGTKMW